MTQHFDITAWTDYARGLVDGTARTAMQVHLDTGCDACRRSLTVAETMMSFAAAEADQAPPAAVVRLAKAIFPVSAATTWRELPQLFAQLVADSLAQPLPAGVRAAAAAPRQVAFEAGDYAIDLRVQRERDARDLWVVGQVQARDGSTPSAAHAPVALFRDEALVAQTTCNEFGEFQVHCPAGRAGQLSIAVDGGQRRIDIDLSTVVAHGRSRPRRDDA